MKERTSVAIDRRLRREAQALARERGISLSRLLNEMLEEKIGKEHRGERFPRSVLLRGSRRAAADHDRLAWKQR